MKTAIRIATALLIVGLSSQHAMAQHNPTWSGIGAAPGTVLSIGFQDFQIVRVPVRDPISGNRYAVTFPAPLIGGQLVSGGVGVTHDSSQFSGNATIDGFTAAISTSDVWSYNINGDGQGGHALQVNGVVTASVVIQLGEALVALGANWQASNPQTGEAPITLRMDVGDTPNAMAVATTEWWKWLDQTALVSAADRWIDYVRVWPFPTNN